MILGENGEKMSKSRGNVVNPDDIVDELRCRYVADCMRCLSALLTNATPWSEQWSERVSEVFRTRLGTFNDMVSEEDGYLQMNWKARCIKPSRR